MSPSLKLTALYLHPDLEKGLCPQADQSIKIHLKTLFKVPLQTFSHFKLIQNFELIIQNNNKSTTYQVAGEGVLQYASKPHSDPFMVLL